MTIEVNSNFKQADCTFGLPGGAGVMMTPPLDAEYFIARVPLHRNQAIVIFPKFGTIGCGFAQEKNWNTNLPISCPAEQIYAHIKHNKKYAAITETQCLEAIRMLQEWATPLMRKRKATA